MFFDSVHIPVMAREVIDFLDLRPGYNIIDSTVGAAGHARRILEKITPGGKLIGIDRDKKILEIAESRLTDFKGSFILKQENFRNLDAVLGGIKIKKINGVL
ncbi:MAG: 16S rRNA (cytosine(1402)-N(4))-methyltransferase, partial [Candidatus Roizmanbacteria bacterium]|nr:16S rRNA (cytosine(1402)-N(4))-methyltransferase [Candidatus Roizmanbacteria bacterium]